MLSVVVKLYSDRELEKRVLSEIEGSPSRSRVRGDDYELVWEFDDAATGLSAAARILAMESRDLLVKIGWWWDEPAAS